MAAWELSIIIQRLVTKLQRGGCVTLRRGVERLLGSRQHPNSEWAAKLVTSMITRAPLLCSASSSTTIPDWRVQEGLRLL